MTRQNKRWNEGEYEILRESYQTAPRGELMRLLPGRTWDAIVCRAGLIGLAQERPAHLTGEEAEIIKEFYTNTSREKLLEMLPGRSWVAIMHHAKRKFGLVRLDYYDNVERFKEITIPEPSEDLAWFLGVLAGDGFIDRPEYTRGRKTRLQSVDMSFINRFEEVGERLFGIKAGKLLVRHYAAKNCKDGYTATFNSTMLARFLGDWRGDTVLMWVNTLKSEFSWVLEDDDYVVAFLCGFFDSDGWASVRTIGFATIDADVQRFTRGLLDRFGIQTAKSAKDVVVCHPDEKRKLANLIQSVIPRKEMGLANFR